MSSRVLAGMAAAAGQLPVMAEALHWVTFLLQVFIKSGPRPVMSAEEGPSDGLLVSLSVHRHADVLIRLY